MSHLLGKAVLEEVRTGDRVLDTGTGCGVDAIMAVSQSHDVMDVDINADAVSGVCRDRQKARVVVPLDPQLLWRRF